MTWWTYVTETAGTDSPKSMQARTGIDGPNFSRWKAGHVPKVDLVARFARAYQRPVLEAFIAAGFLTPAEAKVRPAAAPDYSALTNDELLALVRERMEQGGGAHGTGAAPMTPPDSGPDDDNPIRRLPVMGSRERRVGKLRDEAARESTGGED